MCAVEGSRRAPRGHVLLLVVIALVGLVRGLYWSATTIVLNPVDEHAHYAYVESMARHLRPPVVGRDHLSPDAMELAKRARTSEWRPAPLPPDPDEPRWGPLRESYEGVQGPLYYALMAVPFRLTRLWGVLASLYGVRIATVLLSLTAVPLAYALARELFPRRPDAWLAAPALLVLVQGVNGNLGSVTNDALVLPLATATVWVVARGVRRGTTTRHAVVTGALVGLSLATKSTMVALVPLAAVGVLGAAVCRGEGWARPLRWGLAAGASAGVVLSPWIVWNLVQYGALSAADEVDKITGPFQPELPFTFEGLRQHLVSATVGFWDFQVVGRGLGRYVWAWFGAEAVLLAGALAVSLARRRHREALAFAWLGSSWFTGLATMLVIIYVVFGGRSSVVGRHLYPTLVPLVVLMAAAAFVVAGRWGGWVVLLVVANLALTFEQPLVHARVDRDYAEGLVGHLSPVVDQSYGEGVIAASALRVSPPCPAEALALGFVGSPPPALRVATTAGEIDAPLLGLQGTAAQRLAVYDLPGRVTAPFDVSLQGAALSASALDRDPHVDVAGQVGDAVTRVYCAVDDPRAARFAQLFAPDHPSWIRYGHVRAWPVAWAWTARVGLLGLVGWLLGRWLQRRRAAGRRRRPRLAGVPARAPR